MNTLVALLLAFTAFAAGARRYDSLTEENQKRVKALYGDLLTAHESKNFEKMNSDATQILSFVDDYNDTRSYAAIAQRGIQQLKQEKDPEFQKRKENALHDLAVLEIKGQGLVTKAKTDPDARTELYKTIKQIEVLDPASTYPSEWRKKLHED